MTTPNISGGPTTPAKNGRKAADQQPKRDHRAAVQAHKLHMNLAITALRFGNRSDFRFYLSRSDQKSQNH